MIQDNLIKKAEIDKRLNTGRPVKDFNESLLRMSSKPEKRNVLSTWLQFKVNYVLPCLK